MTINQILCPFFLDNVSVIGMRANRMTRKRDRLSKMLVCWQSKKRDSIRRESCGRPVANCVDLKEGQQSQRTKIDEPLWKREEKKNNLDYSRNIVRSFAQMK